MLFVPLPFVVALLLLVPLATAWRNRDETGDNRAFLALIGLCILQSILLGLRWGYGWDNLRFVLPMLASCLPPLVFLSFSSLTGRRQTGRIVWIHAIPALVAGLLVLAAPDLIDGALIALFVGYAIALFILGRSGPDGLDEARLDDATGAHQALLLAAVSLCVSALLDLTVLLDLSWSRGENVRNIVTFGNLLMLFLIGFTAMVAARSGAPAEPQATPADAPNAEQDREILARVDRLLNEQKLYRDDNLTLARLARRIGLPARQISGAINRQASRNVSQYINDARIAEACRLLRETQAPITSVMLDSGFLTKSNFNREFRRVTSFSPTTWREQHAQDQPR